MSRFLKAMFTLTVCILFVASPALRAWWISDGVPLCTATGTQLGPQAASDGAGGAIVVWYDNFSGNYDIYAQRVSASGNALWATDGIAICTAAGHQMSPNIVPDDAGGAIIAWYDARSGNDDIYVQRVNASGVARWTANGVALCTATGAQQFPRICPDGGGGAIVVWQDNRTGAGLDVYAQRVTSTGAVQWTADGMPLCTLTGNQTDPALISDVEGGTIVVWEDFRNGNYDIYAQRVNIGGTLEWTANGVALCTTTDTQNDPVIAADGEGGAFVAWDDASGTYDNIHAQRLNASGAVQWTANGIAVCAASSHQNNPEIVEDGEGGAIVVWKGTGMGVYAQLINASGAGQWAAGGAVLYTGLHMSADHYICPDGSGGAVVVWEDYPDGSYSIFSQRVTASGEVPWGPDQTPVCTVIGDQRYPSVAPDGTGGTIVAWHDYRNGATDIYAQLVDGAGRAGWLAPDIASVRDIPGDQGGQVFLSWDAARADRFMDSSMSHYSIWRSINSTQAVSAIEDGASEIASLSEFDLPSGDPVIRVEQMGALTIYWQLVDTHDALYMEGYGLPVATLFDSTAACGDPHYFQVVAHTTDQRVFWKSEAASGWSVDNLAPCPPAGFEGEQSFTPIGLYLTWDPNAEGDFSCYALYCGLSADFVPGAGNLVGQFCETSYFDGDWSWDSGYCYKISAFDINGNESEYATFLQGNLTGDDLPAAPAASFLSQNFPNPFNPITKIVFGLAEPAAVRLRVYDAAGRLLRSLIDETMPAGRYSETWDGRDTRGSTVASGVYFYRLDAGAFTETRKMVLLR